MASDDWEIANVGISNPPSPVAFGGSVYCFHQGAGGNNGGDNSLWYSVTNQITWNQWAKDEQINGVFMNGSPSAVNFNNNLYVFHQGSGNSLWYVKSSDGVEWMSDKQVPNTSLCTSPSAVVWKGKIYVFHQDGGNKGELWYNAFDGMTWSGDTQITTAGMSESPSGHVDANGNLLCFYQGIGHSGTLWYNWSSDGSDWSGSTKIPSVGMSSSPSAVLNTDGYTYVFHQGWGGAKQLWVCRFKNGDSWSDMQFGNVGMQNGPGTILVNGNMYAFHQGGSNASLWYVQYHP